MTEKQLAKGIGLRTDIDTAKVLWAKAIEALKPVGDIMIHSDNGVFGIDEELIDELNELVDQHYEDLIEKLEKKFAKIGN